MNYSTLNEALKDRAREDLFVNFIEGGDEEIRFTYRELHQRALALLHVFQQHGLRPGDELIFFLKQNAVFIEAFWACLLGGIIPVPVAVGISDEHRSKLIRIFGLLRAPHLLIDRKAAQLLQTFALKHGYDKEYNALEAATLVQEDLQPGSEAGHEHDPSPDDLAFIQFSSGSTRDPKGVQLTHRNLITNVIDLGNRAGYSSEDISLSWMPLTHDLGLIGFHINMLVFGINQHIMATDLFSRRPLMWLQKVSEHRASILSSPNFGYKHYLKMYRTREDHDLDLSCVRLILNGAEPVSVALCDEFLDSMAAHGMPRTAMYPSYGLAEASLAVAMPVPGRVFEYLTLDRRSLNIGQAVTPVTPDHPHAVRFAVEGSPLERCAVRIGDGQGNDLGLQVIGEIQLKGPNVTAGYYHDPEANREAFTPDGWLRTGDLGLLHEGRLVITGRLKDIIFAHGQNFYPHDLEAIALEVEGLELGKVVALGVRIGESDHDDILVCVLHRGALEDFIPHVRAVKQIISEQTGLEVTHVLPVRRVPKTTSGKIQRRFFADAYRAGEYEPLIEQIDKLLGTAAKTRQPSAAGSPALLETVKALCAEAIPEKTPAVDDNFFEIGLSSLDLSMFQERLDEHFPGRIDITDLFDHPTLTAVAAFLERGGNSSDEAQGPEVRETGG